MVADLGLFCKWKYVLSFGHCLSLLWSNFFAYLLVKAQQRQLAWVVSDEIHFILTFDYYQPALKIIKQFYHLPVPIVELSTTIPHLEILELCEKIHTAMCAWYSTMDHQETTLTTAKKEAIGWHGKEAEAITFWNMDKFTPKLKTEKSSIGAKGQQAWLCTDQCLCLNPEEFFNGYAQSC